MFLSSLKLPFICFRIRKSPLSQIFQAEHPQYLVLQSEVLFTFILIIWFAILHPEQHSKLLFENTSLTPWLDNPIHRYILKENRRLCPYKDYDKNALRSLYPRICQQKKTDSLADIWAKNTTANLWKWKTNTKCERTWWNLKSILSERSQTSKNAFRVIPLPWSLKAEKTNLWIEVSCMVTSKVCACIREGGCSGLEKGWGTSGGRWKCSLSWYGGSNMGSHLKMWKISSCV